MTSRASLLQVALCTITITYSSAVMGYHPNDGIIDDFFANQAAKQVTFEATLNSILARYPQYTTNIIKYTAAHTPKNYHSTFEQIGTVNAAYLPEALLLHLENTSPDFEQLIKAALRAEPSYSDTIVDALINKYPEKVEQILLFALTVEPDSADQYITIAGLRFPSKAPKFLNLVFANVPLVGPYVLESMMLHLPNTSEALIKESIPFVINDKKQYQRLLNCAERIGFSETRVNDIANND